MGLSLRDALEKIGLKATKAAKTTSRPTSSSKTSKDVRNNTISRPTATSTSTSTSASASMKQQPKPEAKRPQFETKTREREQERAKEREDEVQDAPIIRTTCGACRNPAPDVEFYLHSRRNLQAQWLCTICADKFQIADESRQTDSSDLSKRRMFRREFGRTKRYGFARSMQELRKRIDAFERGEDTGERGSGDIDERTQNRHRSHVQQQEKLVHEGLLSHHLRDYKSRDMNEQRDYNRRDRGDRTSEWRNNERRDQRPRTTAAPKQESSSPAPSAPAAPVKKENDENGNA